MTNQEKFDQLQEELESAYEGIRTIVYNTEDNRRMHFLVSEQMRLITRLQQEVKEMLDIALESPDEEYVPNLAEQLFKEE